MMSTCLIGFLLMVSALGEPNIYQNLVYFTRIGDFTWRVSDWKNKWGLPTGDDGGYSVKVTPLILFEVPEVLEVHEVPSEEVRMVPDSPTVTKSPFP